MKLKLKLSLAVILFTIIGTSCTARKKQPCDAYGNRAVISQPSQTNLISPSI